MKKITRLFTRLSIKQVDAERCARVLAPPSQNVTFDRRNPGQKKCADHFLQALLQADIGTGKFSVKKIVENLSCFGLTKRRYYLLRKGRFTPNCIKNTSLNRKQIRVMAKSFNQNPKDFLEALLDL